MLWNGLLPSMYQQRGCFSKGGGVDLRILNLIVVFLLMASAALAHHGKDYMEIEEYSTPERGEYLAFSLFEYHAPGSGTLHYWKLEPRALFGVTDNVALEAHLHLTSPEGASMAYESTALEARF